MEPLGGEFVPRAAERLDHRAVVGEKPVTEMALTQIQPDTLDRVQLGGVRRQRHQGYVLRHPQLPAGVPARLVQGHHRMLIRGTRGGEALDEDVHRFGGNMRQHQGEVLARLGTDRGEQMRPGVALIAAAGRALSAGEPAMADPPLLAEPGLVLEPEAQALLGMRGTRGVKGGLQPPFANTSRAAGSAFGCDGRAFCQDRPRLCISLPIGETL